MDAVCSPRRNRRGYLIPSRRRRRFPHLKKWLRRVFSRNRSRRSAAAPVAPELSTHRHHLVKVHDVVLVFQQADRHHDVVNHDTVPAKLLGIVSAEEAEDKYTDEIVDYLSQDRSSAAANFDATDGVVDLGMHTLALSGHSVNLDHQEEDDKNVKLRLPADQHGATDNFVFEVWAKLHTPSSADEAKSSDNDTSVREIGLAIARTTQFLNSEKATFDELHLAPQQMLEKKEYLFHVEHFHRPKGSPQYTWTLQLTNSANQVLAPDDALPPPQLGGKYFGLVDKAAGENVRLEIQQMQGH